MATLKDRLARGAAPGEPDAPPAAQPPESQPEPGEPAPAPASEPAHPEPPAPTPPPSVDTEKVNDLSEKNANLERQVSDMVEASKARDSELSAFQQLEAQKMQLPSTTELDGMTQGEASLKIAEHMKAYQDATIRGLVKNLNETVVEPLQRDVSAAMRGRHEQEIDRVYPGMSDKYGPKVHDMLAKSPNLTAIEALKAVANPGDLMQSVQTPKTPAPAAGVPQPHFEGGMSAHSSAAPPQGAPSGKKTVMDHIEDSLKAMNEGRRYEAGEHRRAGLKQRLIKPEARAAG